ncbi:MAG TPA: hypothetical protein VGS80_06790 [Ktedonobacterales bacterium]|nr:hypothetical protein [Ktedonobacterales bacterium]
MPGLARSRLARATPVHLRWWLLVLLYCAPQLLLARALLDITTWDSPVTLHPAIGFFMAYAAVIGFFVAALLMPHARRHGRSGPE